MKLPALFSTFLSSVSDLLFGTNPFDQHTKYHVPWSSAHTGWFNRSIPPTNTTNTPIQADLLFEATYSAPGGSGLIASFYAPNLMLTASGAAYEVLESDFAALNELAGAVADLPREGPATPGMSRHYEVFSSVSCRTWTTVRVVRGDSVDETGVYAYSKGLRRLQDGGELPVEVWELLGLVGEVSESEV